MLDEIVIKLVPPEDKIDCGQEYDVTCTICYFQSTDCESLPAVLKMCDWGKRGYFKIQTDKE